MIAVALVAPLGFMSGAAQPAARAPAVATPPGTAPWIDGLEGFTHAIDSTHPQVRRYYDQGMLLAYGFNASEAARSFEAAVLLDPTCASAWWALAWAMGPNINADMEPRHEARVLEALQQARRHAQAVRVGTVRRDLIGALSLRHPGPGRIDEEGYAERMQTLVRRHPDSAEVALLAAEALLNLHPYDWWDASGEPKPVTPRIESLLQQTLRLAPGHPGAHHYRIHLHESSRQPQRAKASADALRDAYPGSGHLLHMPSHIDMRLGHYQDAIRANQRSIEADRRYLAQVDAQGAYRVGYVAHNHHFLWAAASMAGEQQLALDAAQAAWPAACGPAGRDPGLAITAHYAVLPFFTRVRFGLWDDLLRRTPPPDAPGPYALAMFHAARGTAAARTGEFATARRELATLQRLAAQPALGTARVKNINPAAQLLRIAELTLRADIALEDRQHRDAVGWLREATAIEDALVYDEPHLWLAPTRHALGAALLAAGDAAQAERACREDLAHYPSNGWSLGGLALALAAQGRRKASRAAEVAASVAFAGLQRKPHGSRF